LTATAWLRVVVAADAAGWDRLSAAGCVEGPRKKVLKIDTRCAGEGS